MNASITTTTAILQRTLKWLALLFLSISPLVALLALGFSFLSTSPVIGLVLFYMILAVSASSKIVFYVLLSEFDHSDTIDLI
jgi:hypothetical protein